MEAMLHAVRRLRNAGYELDLRAVAGGRLRCPACRTLVHGGDAIVTETVRFEGISNPEDQAILDAVITPCGHRGLFSAAYGVYASPEDVDVLQALGTGSGSPSGGPAPP
jgi:hypothetical protein